VAEKENSVHHVLNTLARRGDPSSLRASASLALMLGDDSTEERICRYQEKAEEKKALNMEGNSEVQSSNTQFSYKSLNTKSDIDAISSLDELKFDSNSTSNFIKTLKADVEIKKKDIDEKDHESLLGSVSDGKVKNSNVNLTEVPFDESDSLKSSHEVTTSQTIETTQLDKHVTDNLDKEVDYVGTSTTDDGTVLIESGQIEINLSSDEETEI